MRSQRKAKVWSQMKQNPCVSPDCTFRTGQVDPISAGGGGDQERLQGLSWGSVTFYWDAVFMSILTLQKCIKFMLLEVLQFSSVTHSCPLTLPPHEPQHVRPPCPSPTPGAYSNSSPLSRWCHPTLSSSVVPFSSCPQSFPTSESFQISQLFASSGQNIGVSASTSVLPMNTQDWFPLGWTGWISLQSKGLSRIFSNTTVQKHQFFSAQLSL